MSESNCTYLLCFRVYSINAMTNYVRTILHLAYELTLANIYDLSNSSSFLKKILIEQFNCQLYTTIIMFNLSFTRIALFA